MTDEWFYKRGEAVYGPVTGAMLHDLILRGRLSGDVPVRCDGTEKWMPAAQAKSVLPPVLEAPTPPAEEVPVTFQESSPSISPSFDASLPGASILYAPPQESLINAPSGRKVPAYLQVAVMITKLFLISHMAVWTLSIVTYAGDLAEVERQPAWLLGVGKLMEETKLLFIVALLQLMSVIIWQGCSFASLRRLYGKGMVRRSLVSGLWWIVPIAAIFMPLFCFRDMRYLSRWRRDNPNPRASFGPLLITFEVLFLMDVPFAVINGMMIYQAAMHGAANPLLSWLHLGSDVQAVALSFVVFLIVHHNFRQQKELYGYWDDDSHWRGLYEGG